MREHTLQIVEAAVERTVGETDWLDDQPEALEAIGSQLQKRAYRLRKLKEGDSSSAPELVKFGAGAGNPPTTVPPRRSREALHTGPGRTAGSGPDQPTSPARGEE